MHVPSYPVPNRRIVGEKGEHIKEEHHNSGCMIQLTCVVDNVPHPHAPLVWTRGEVVLRYNTSVGGIR